MLELTRGARKSPFIRFVGYRVYTLLKWGL